MNYLIYQNSNFIEYGMKRIEGSPGIIRPQNLTLVGRVRANSLDDAYRITNHIDQSWSKNPEVVWWRPARSTSVGDVILNMDDGTFHSVERFGFKEIHSWWIGGQLLEKDLPDEPEVFVDVFTVNRSPYARLRRLVLRQLSYIRAGTWLSRLRK